MIVKITVKYIFARILLQGPYHGMKCVLYSSPHHIYNMGLTVTAHSYLLCLNPASQPQCICLSNR